MKMLMFKYFLCFFFLFFVFQNQVQAALRILPTRFEYSIKPRTERFVNGAITVQAATDETIRFKVYPKSFNIDETGGMDTDSKNISESPIAKYIRFNPAEVTITSGNPQKVRFTITNIKDLPDGESRIALLFENIKTKEQVLPTSSSTISAYVTIKTIVGVPIYIDKGQTVKTGEIKKLEIGKSNDKYFYTVNVKSNGNSKIRVDGTAQIIKDKNLVAEFPINSQPVQAGTIGKLQGELPVQNLTPGEEYKLKVTLSFKDQKEKQQYLVNDVDFKFDNPVKGMQNFNSQKNNLQP
ncbi:MAG: hypothetical protein ACD_20C00152G0004 [uncultured bacterium]|nr:MAG: hypothetical protein ACD_20C00152G0004 [uncultured bacterium]